MNWIVLNKATKVPEITINGFIGQYAKVNYADFKNALNQLKDDGVKKCKLFINSGGGDMIEGLALYDAAAESGIEFEVQVIGMAASMGSLLMFVGVGKPTISKNARVMFHKPQAGAHGEAEALRNRANLCDDLETAIKNILIERSGKTTEEVAAWFVSGKETWMSAVDAVKNGVCASIVPSASDDLELPDPAEEATEEEVYNKVYNQISNKTKTDMKYSIEAKTNLGLPANSTDSEVDAFLVNLKNKAAKADSLESEMEANAKLRAKTLVTNAIADKKLTEADRAEYEAKAVSDFDFVSNMLSKITKPTLPAGNTEGGGANPTNEDRSKWTLADWAKNDFEGLNKMKVEDKSKYTALCKVAGIEVSY